MEKSSAEQSALSMKSAQTHVDCVLEMFAIIDAQQETQSLATLL